MPTPGGSWGWPTPVGREMMISCGAALFTARLALRSLGYIPETSVLPDPGRPLLVARVSWRRRAAAAEFEQRLFSQVPLRRTHRGGFDPLPLPPDLVAVLASGRRAGWCDAAIVVDDGRPGGARRGRPKRNGRNACTDSV